MTREETKKAIEVMQAYVDGEVIEWSATENREGEWMEASAFPDWNWWDCDYRVKRQPMKVTEEEKERMERVWVKLKGTDCLNYVHFKEAANNEKYYILNPDTMEWEDRSEK